MKNDFKTIYGYGVVKTDFTFPVDTRALTDVYNADDETQMRDNNTTRKDYQHFEWIEQ